MLPYLGRKSLQRSGPRTIESMRVLRAEVSSKEGATSDLDVESMGVLGGEGVCVHGRRSGFENG